MERSDLDIWTVILPDKVQKQISISREEHKKLKTLKVVEGRYPNIYVSSWVAAVTGEKARHIRLKGFNKRYYLDIIIKLIQEHGPVSRKDIDKLLVDKLPEILTEKQKKNKVHNLLTELSGPLGKIHNIGSRKNPQWILGDEKNNKKV